MNFDTRQIGFLFLGLTNDPEWPLGDGDGNLRRRFHCFSQPHPAPPLLLLLLLPSPSSLLHLLPSASPRFHNDGRMLDTFQRLSAREGDYFLPRDLELSNQELSHIVKKAEQWRGFNGERRKVKAQMQHCSVTVFPSSSLLSMSPHQSKTAD